MAAKKSSDSSISSSKHVSRSYILLGLVCVWFRFWLLVCKMSSLVIGNGLILSFSLNLNCIICLCKRLLLLRGSIFLFIWISWHYLELTVSERIIIRIGPKEYFKDVKHFQWFHYLIPDDSDDSSSACLGADGRNSYQQI